MSDRSKAPAGNIVATGLAAALVVGSIYHAVVTRSLENDARNLRNQIAERDQTIEVAKGLFQRRTQELELDNGKLKDLLDNSENQVHMFTEQVERDRLKVLALNELVVKWKKAYEGKATEVVQDPVENPKDPDKPRQRIQFGQTFGPIRASGWTITDPPEAYVKVEQVRPLKLIVAVAKRTDGSWGTTVSSSEEDMQVDISVSAVDLSVTKRRWYEGIELRADVPLTDGAPGLGLSYDIGKFSVGPTIRYDGELGYGMSLGWRPFQR